MGIKVQPSGYGEAIIQLGQLAGQAEVTKRDIDRKDRLAAEVRQQNQRNQEININRFFSEQARQDEIVTREKERTDNERLRKETQELSHQWDIEAFNRSKSWELTKFEMASRVDFLREEDKRQKDLDELDAKKKAVLNSDILTGEEKKKWLLEIETNIPLASRTISSKGESPTQQIMAQMLGKQVGTSVAQPTSSARVWSESGESAQPSRGIAGSIPAGIRPIETAVDLLGQIEAGKRATKMKGEVVKQTEVMGERLVDTINKTAGFEKQTISGVPSYSGGMPTGYIQTYKWPKDALNREDVVKLNNLTAEEMATARSVLASGDPTIVREFIKTLKQIK